MLVHAFYVSFSLPVIVTRGNNVYGPRQYPEKLVPKFTMQLLSGAKCTLHGDGSNARSFMHVKDAASAFVVLLRRASVGRVYNLGSVTEVRVSRQCGRSHARAHALTRSRAHACPCRFATWT